MKGFFRAILSALSRVCRIGLRLVALAVVCASLAFAALYLLITPERVAQRIAGACAESPLSLTYEGAPSVKLLPSLEVALSNPVLGTAEGASLARAQTLRLRVSLASLLFGEVRIKQADLENGAFDAALTSETLSVLLSTPLKQTSFFKRIAVTKLLMTNMRLEAASDAARPLALTFERFEVADPAPQMHAPFAAKGRLAGGEKELDFAFEAQGDFDLDLLEGVALVSHASLHAAGTIAREPASFELDVQSLSARNASLSVSGLNATVEALSQTAGLHVAEGVSENARFTGTVSFKYAKGPENFRTSLALTSPVVVSSEGFALSHLEGSLALAQSQPVSFTGSLSRQGAQTYAAELGFRAGNRDFSAKGDLEPGAPLRFKGGVRINALSERDLFDETLVPLAESLKALCADISRGYALFAGDYRRQDSVQEASDDLLDPNAGSEPLQQLTWMDDIAFEGEVSVEALRVAGLPLSRFAGKVVLDAHALTVTEGQAVLADAPVQLRASVNRAQDWTLSMKTHAASYEPVARSLGAQRPAPGRLSLETNLYGRGFEAQGVNGQLGFLLMSTRLYGTDIAADLPQAARGAQTQVSETAFTEVSRLRGLANFANGKGVIENLSIECAQGRFTGRAALDLAVGSLEGSLRTHVGLTRATLTLGNTWLDPLASLNAVALSAGSAQEAQQEQAGQAPAAPEDARRKEAKPSRWEAFKDYLKGLF